MKWYIDPGSPLVGWACFEGGRLVLCGISRTPKEMKDVRARAEFHKAALVDLGAYAPASEGVLSECMWFRHSGKRMDPQDLIDVNLVAGHVATRWTLPHEWKGMVSKENHQPKILEKLDEKELALVNAVMPKSLRHNVIDAVGIGLVDNERLLRGETTEDTCNPVKQLTKRLRKRTAKASGSTRTTSGRGRKSTSGTAKSGPRRKKPSFVVLPTGSMRMPARTDRVTWDDRFNSPA
jgi:hypothetical protein